MSGRVRFDLRWAVFGVVATVAAFAFVVSYSHIYDLGLAHAQFGVAARLLPLSVDLLIIGASLVLFLEGRKDTQIARQEGWLARWLPRSVLWAAIGATVAANVAYGLPHGWLAAVISGWPGAAFVAAVEVAMVTVRPAAARTPARTPVRTPPLPTVAVIRESGVSQATAMKIREWIRADRRDRGVPPPPVAGGRGAVSRSVPAAVSPNGNHPVSAPEGRQ